jgi:hypothetical protein
VTTVRAAWMAWAQKKRVPSGPSPRHLGLPAPETIDRPFVLTYELPEGCFSEARVPGRGGALSNGFQKRGGAVRGLLADKQARARQGRGGGRNRNNCDGWVAWAGEIKSTTNLNYNVDGGHLHLDNLQEGPAAEVVPHLGRLNLPFLGPTIPRLKM